MNAMPSAAAIPVKIAMGRYSKSSAFIRDASLAAKVMIRVPARRASPVSIAAEASAVRHGPQDETTATHGS